MYENKQDWTVDYVVDNTLTDKVFIMGKPQLYTAAEKINALPSSYYSLAPTGTVAIPKGSMNGLIRVQLTDAFFDDPQAITGHYVIPLRLTGTSADSILQGKASITGADPRVSSQWLPNMSPKNWVMYGISYFNAYHGTYLHRGRDLTKSAKTGNDTTIIFRSRYVEKDALRKLVTSGRKTAISDGLANQNGGKFSMLLTFTNDKGTPGNIIISQAPASTIVVTGTGQYNDLATSKEQWTGMTWQSMYLQYSYNDGTYNHVVNDTLVFRDRGIKYNTNSIVVQP
jgi:hypothetical protein